VHMSVVMKRAGGAMCTGPDKKVIIITGPDKKGSRPLNPYTSDTPTL